MMISNKEYKEAYVWIWLPEETEPVVAGKLAKTESYITFNYGKSYLERDNAISIYDKELPLHPGPFMGLSQNEPLPRAIRDSSPDAWGRRVILNNKLGLKGKDTDSEQLDELTYLLESGSDRIGALDFQLSPTEYIPRIYKDATLEELLQSAEKVEVGIALSPEIDQALNHGSSIGGARPKALITSDTKKYIAKFSSSSDLYSVIKAEYIAMRLAKICGLNVAEVKLSKALNKDILLIERFDRELTTQGWQRKLMLSALTLLNLDAMTAQYASYEDLVEIIRHRFSNHKEALYELFSRIVFNILCGNTDDHARNHAAFWSGKELSLTPAYDICPQQRTGTIASQAMFISAQDRSSKIKICINAANNFMLSEQEAKEITEKQVELINQHWDNICKEAELSQVDKNLLWHRQFLNPYAFE